MATAPLPAANYQSVHDTITAALNGLKLRDGSFLTASNVVATLDAASDAQIPFLMLNSGSIVSTEWEMFTTENKLDIPAWLKVKGEGEGGGSAAIRAAVEDLYAFLARIRGLPVTADGKIHPFDDKTPALFHQNKLTLLATRGGPFIRTVKVTDDPTSPYATAELMIHVEFFAEHDPTVYKRVAVVEVGMQVIDASQATTDFTIPFALNVPSPVSQSNTYAVTAFDQPFPVITQAGNVIPRHDVPAGKIPTVAGDQVSKTLSSVAVIPGSLTFSHLATTQLQAVATFGDGSTQNVDPGATWGTSDATKATVSTTGLVTGVAAGTCTITATYLGVAAVAALTLT